MSHQRYESLREASAQLRSSLGPNQGKRQPFKERGKRLATIRRDHDSELHVAWDEYEGKPYLSIRLWVRGTDGNFYPDKTKGITVRIRELADFADGVLAAIDEAKAHVAEHRSLAPSHSRLCPAPSNQADDDPVDDGLF